MTDSPPTDDYISMSCTRGAEPELSVLTRQCFTDRVETQAEVGRRTSEWASDRNTRQKGIDWQFATDKARTKLKRLDPKIELQ